MSETSARSKAARLAGSLRLAGMAVSADNEDVMARIISGELDATQLRSELHKKYKRKKYP